MLHPTHILKADKYLLPRKKKKRSMNLCVSEEWIHPGEKRLLTFQIVLTEKEFSSGSMIQDLCKS